MILSTMQTMQKEPLVLLLANIETHQEYPELNLIQSMWTWLLPAHPPRISGKLTPIDRNK